MLPFAVRVVMALAEVAVISVAPPASVMDPLVEVTATAEPVARW